MTRFYPFLIIIMILLAACQSNQPHGLTPEETAEYMDKGKAIVQKSFKALSSQLARAMNEGGVQNAVSYCNIKANPITDSLSKVYGVTISRTSLRPRNPGNTPGQNESDIMADFLQMKSEGKELFPFVGTDKDGGVTFYAPISIISPLCLKCHGEVGTDVLQEDYDLIRSLYPDDQATGYTMGEFRGMWKVEFNQL